MLCLSVIGVALLASTSCRQLFNPELEKMQGVWEAKGSEKQIISLIVQDDSVILFLETGEQGVKTKLELDSSKEPKRFDLVFPDNGGKFERWQGIYELSDKLIKAAFSDPRPTSFTEKNTWLFEWKGKSSNFTPVDPDYIKGVATWNYWMRLHNIHNPIWLRQGKE
jgi:uncharacterized protein (TIGR03067 family)